MLVNAAESRQQCQPHPTELNVDRSGKTAHVDRATGQDFEVCSSSARRRSQINSNEWVCTEEANAFNDNSQTFNVEVSFAHQRHQSRKHHQRNRQSAALPYRSHLR